MKIYLDWNVFDRIEKKEKLEEGDRIIYSELLTTLNKSSNQTPYSNAHLRDLLRGYKKNPKYIDGHLKILEAVTNNLCICHYWNQKNVTLHYRSVVDFFNELKDEKEFEIDNIDEVIEADTTGLMKSVFDLLKFLEVPKEFALIYREDPIFGVMYPRTREEMTHYALTADLVAVAFMMNKDYSLYRSLKKYINKARVKLKKNRKLLKLDNNKLNISGGTHKYLEMDTIIDDHLPNMSESTSKNFAYRDIFDVFLRCDLKGYKSDNMFTNMIDDGLHTFYASYCDVFITNDDKCHYKAIKTYERLKLRTKVFTAKEFIEQ